MAMCRAGWRVVYEERARAWTEAPATLEQLYRQRYRWSYGTMQAMWKHRRALFDSGDSGRFGRRGLPFLALFGVVLPLLAPLVDVMLVYGLVFWDRSQTVVAWLAMLALQAVTAFVAFRFDGESLRPLWKLPLQQFAYRQLMYLVLIQSAMTAMTGGRLRWHKLHRAGLHGAAHLENGVEPVSDEYATARAHAEAHAALTETTAEQPLVQAAAREALPVVRQVTAGRAKVPEQGVAPVLDSWPSILPSPPARHPAAGRATARPPLVGGVPGQATAAHHGPGPRGPVSADPADEADDDNNVLEPSTSDGWSQDGATHDLQPLDETALRRH
jgi:hypothetical protein